MPDFKKHSDVLVLLSQAQASEEDVRNDVRVSREFIHLKDGMWEPEVWAMMDGHPRYSIDKTTPLVEETTGRIKKSDFGIKVLPGGNDASEDTADLLAGMVRNIHNISGADHIFNAAATEMVEGGYGGWEIVQGYPDTPSYDQDIFIRRVANFVDSVWFDHNSQKQDRSDSKYAFKLVAYSKDAYDEKWPKGSGESVGQNNYNYSTETKAENVIVGMFYCLKEVSRDVVRMTDGQVFLDDDKYQQVADDLALKGITEKDRRKSTVNRLYIRQFDGGGWLNEEQPTAFSYITLIPEYGKFRVINNQVKYRGMVLKLMDPQRVYNYARSRQIEEGALAPRDKILATTEQMQGHTTAWATMNTNSDPALPYNHVDGQPIPFKIGGSQVNPGLATTAADMTADMREVANKFSASMGDGINASSGVLVDELKESSDVGDIDWTESHEIALCHTARVIIDAIPRVYDATRMVRIIGEDGATSMEKINAKGGSQIDAQTGEVVMLNDLSRGRYDAVYTAGKSYKTRQGETISGILEIGKVDPNIILEAEDILVAASDTPGSDLIAERIRSRKMREGSIPESQWTDEERQQIKQAQAQAANQPPQPDPMMLAAQAEMQKAQAEIMSAQNKQAEIQGNQQISMTELQLRDKEIDLATQKFIRAGEDKYNVEAAKIDQGQQKIDLQAQEQQLKAIVQSQQFQAQQFNDMFTNLKTISDTMQTFVGPSVVEAGVNQAEAITEEQEDGESLVP